MTTRPRPSNPVRLVPEFGPINEALFKATGNGSVPQSAISAGQPVGNTAPARPARRR
ncbi:hypothetical protein [Streptomyces guryensis]|uniref:Uncharacterized protein n=1 Tax=Streptomyces guryensis TaxID=2886947 RepID=A0A9Q3VR28_9ACTN|nr:hypothetical protein [Streptomyces guryensis]MCD9875858.1 hypothetical protein [Streptomyces guryensis]